MSLPSLIYTDLLFIDHDVSFPEFRTTPFPSTKGTPNVSRDLTTGWSPNSVGSAGPAHNRTLIDLTLAQERIDEEGAILDALSSVNIYFVMQPRL